ncbi:MAG TPA: hypothetical protein VFR43_12275 [Gaiellaceae bacterium]|nr:hypothetical protein [Gaiellaceae bacterium]
MAGDASGRVEARVPAVIEHRRGRSGRLRRRRLTIALVLAVVQGFLVLLGVLPWWGVLLLAALGLALYVGVGRESSSGDLRDTTWILAVSQLVVVLVPVLAVLVSALAVAALLLLAAVALVAVLRDRR